MKLYANVLAPCCGNGHVLHPGRSFALRDSQEALPLPLGEPSYRQGSLWFENYVHVRFVSTSTISLLTIVKDSSVYYLWMPFSECGESPPRRTSQGTPARLCRTFGQRRTLLRVNFSTSASINLATWSRLTKRGTVIQLAEEHIPHWFLPVLISCVDSHVLYHPRSYPYTRRVREAQAGGMYTCTFAWISALIRHM